MIAFLALTAQPQGFAIQLTLWTSTLSHIPLLAPGAFVDRVRHPLPLALELALGTGYIAANGTLMTPPKGELFAGQ